MIHYTILEKLLISLDIRVTTCHNIYINEVGKSNENIRIKKAAKKDGLFIVREGSKHEIWKSPVTGREFTVGRHGNKDVPIGTAENILKAAGLR